MGELSGSATVWLAGSAAALVALVVGHDAIAAGALALVAPAAVVARRARRADRRASSVIAGVEAVGLAAVGVTVAATSTTPAAIAAATAIAFAAVVQQYAALVFGHIAAGLRTPIVHPSLGGHARTGATLGLASALAFDRSAWLLVVIAVASGLECVWGSVRRGIAIARSERIDARAPILPPLAGRARWTRLGEGLAAARDGAFWGLVIARPLARVVLQLLAEWRWLTPNRITAASIAVCLAAAAVIATGGSVGLAVSLIFVRSIFDSLDGQLARYRACGSSFGSYVDKVSDLFCWGALFGALAIRVHVATGSATLLGLALLSPIIAALLGLALWMARLLAPAMASSSPPSQLGVAAWARSLWRIALFEEPDFYLWIALALATARYDLFVPLIAGAYVARALVMGIARINVGARSIGKESPA